MFLLRIIRKIVQKNQIKFFKYEILKSFNILAVDILNIGGCVRGSLGGILKDIGWGAFFIHLNLKEAEGFFSG
jgi:hypothetical protein